MPQSQICNKNGLVTCKAYQGQEKSHCMSVGFNSRMTLALTTLQARAWRAVGWFCGGRHNYIRDKSCLFFFLQWQITARGGFLNYVPVSAILAELSTDVSRIRP